MQQTQTATQPEIGKLGGVSLKDTVITEFLLEETAKAKEEAERRTKQEGVVTKWFEEFFGCLPERVEGQFAFFQDVQVRMSKFGVHQPVCHVVSKCEKCDDLLESFSCTTLAQVGQQITNPTWESHYCNPPQPETESTDAKLLALLREFIMENSYQGEY